MAEKRDTSSKLIEVDFSPSPDADLRLRRVMELLLAPKNDDGNEEQNEYDHNQQQIFNQ